MATKTKNSDSKTLDLIKEVNRQKAEISKAEKPDWKTHCSFSYTEGSANTTNLHQESNIRNLVLIAGFLRDKQASYWSAVQVLGVDAPAFTWQGFSLEDWINDLRSRINKIQIIDKKKKLEVLEARLNAIISPELRAELELQAIEDELK